MGYQNLIKKHLSCMPKTIISMAKIYNNSKKKNMILFTDYKRQHEEIKENFYRELKGIFSFSDDKDYFFYEKEFESKFAKLCNKPYAITMNSGTSAIQFSLGVKNFEKDSEIITVPNTYPGAILPIINLGYKPKFVDIEKKNFNIDPDKIKDSLTEKTKAIIATHLYGYPAAMEKISKIAKDNKLQLIEDCAQAFGTSLNGKMVPYGELGIFSFHTSKVLGGFGNGGVITTKKKKYKLVLEEMKEPLTYSSKILKSKRTPSYIDELQIAMINSKIPFINNWIKKRQEISKCYSENLFDLPIKIPLTSKNAKHSFFSYTIKTKNPKIRNKLKNYLLKKNIETRVLYNIYLPSSNAFKKYFTGSKRLNVFEETYDRILSLPIYPQLKDEEIEHITKEIKQFYKKHNQ